MKRMHLHVSVPDLAQSIRFYESLFGAAPSVVKDDYAKWMLDDPRVNFAISEREREPGVDHIGIQTDTSEELAVLAGRLKAAGAETFDQTATTCCYARSDKSWVRDPAGVRWETFYTFGEATTYGEDEKADLTPAAAGADAATSACCGAPAPAEAAATPAASCC
ncbi:MAG: glyoxalase/bleomycin resistance/dioxygenase family protein [Phenylobacterium sp.]|uniref:ArsI/CadI family heavy metal resistance metalloenzyme n=1 Tax=Phenylobacterium sp. TaxID=1871053 RepID=UPI00120A1E6B|nr:ArsI/CadI family heavy metal resistance metalloenzyme [Phenylobacterium sp.]TAJ69889.1 MAG: glyoxalase/bleomycin resistance/dioxygenase family protein [Phenylobacterium sp.]